MLKLLLSNARKLRTVAAAAGLLSLLICAISIQSISQSGSAAESPTQNPTLILSGHDTSPAFIATPNNTLPPNQVSGNYAPTPPDFPIPPGSGTPDVITVPTPNGSNVSSTNGALPAISAVNQFNENSPTGYGDPPNNTSATDGQYVGAFYNSGSGETMNFSSISTGAGVLNYNFCGIDGYNGCSDTNIRFDRINSVNRWVASYLSFPSPFTQGGVVALAVSVDSNINDGFDVWGLGQESSGAYDAPRLGISNDKVVVTADDYNNADCTNSQLCTRMFVVNKSQLYSLQGFNFDEYTGTGINYQPVDVTGFEATTLFEAPDFAHASNVIVTHYLYGAQGSEQWATTIWFVAPMTQVNPLQATQPYTTKTLDADANEFEAAVYTGSVAWVTGNDVCNALLLCPRFDVFNVDGFGRPTGLNHDFDVASANGSDLFYAALSTTVGTNSVLGVLDYTCANCNPVEYASAGMFELTTTGGYTGGAYEAGNSDVPPDQGQNYHRWGDINGCGYVPGSSPARAACIGEFALSLNSNSEVFIVSG